MSEQLNQAKPVKPSATEDTRPNADSRWCLCGASLRDHATVAPFGAEETKCSAFSLDTTRDKGDRSY